MESINNEIRLRTFSDKDFPVIARLCNNKNIWDNLRDMMPYPYSEEDAKEFIKYCLGEEPQMTFAIEYNSEVAGVIGLVRQTDIYRMSAELGYWIGEPYWGKGIAGRAVKLITDYGFNKLGLARIYSGVFDFNKASQRVLEKCGFKLEAIFEKSVIKNNIILDEYRYALINKHL